MAAEAIGLSETELIAGSVPVTGRKAYASALKTGVRVGVRSHGRSSRGRLRQRHSPAPSASLQANGRLDEANFS